MKKRHRRAGVLLHISSLPGAEDQGTLGDDAFRFVDFLSSCGFKIWQLLPVGLTHEDNSPYQSLSAFAGNIKFISVDKLRHSRWVDANQYQVFFDSAFPDNVEDKFGILKHLFYQFQENGNEEELQLFETFKQKNHFWLNDFSLFIVLKLKHANHCWTQWPDKLRNYDLSALDELRVKYSEEILFENFCQFVFFQQWTELKNYANSHNIQLVGDLPLFVAHDSADVWSRRELFKLEHDGQPVCVAGVPPDYFSETGQRWGNPVYDWKSIEADGYQWWLDRLKVLLEIFDVVRIDHFRGLEAYWEIAATEETAINGIWKKGPGEAFFQALLNEFDEPLPFIAEDLGIITEEVDDLRFQFDLPGMKILQFAFDGNGENPYLPHNHEINSYVYTGTHDNNTIHGWFDGLDESTKKFIPEYYNYPEDDVAWLFIRAAFSSVAEVAIVPMQDLLSLNGMHRMNTPGTTEGNWSWRFQWQECDEHKIRGKIKWYCQLYSR